MRFSVAMTPAIYGDLTAFYPLLDPAEDHEEDAALYVSIAERLVDPPPATLLELGAGAGNNILYLEKHMECTASDISEEMLSLSRARNPECTHVRGDMRTLRLDRTFDVVLIHDAISYMTSRDDLRAACETAHHHTRPGGITIFAPDCFRESFFECSQFHQGDDGSRALRCIEWFWDPDPTDETCLAEYALLLRDGGEMRAVHDRHVFGLFEEAVWREIIEGVGFGVEVVERPLPAEANPYTSRMLVGKR